MRMPCWDVILGISESMVAIIAQTSSVRCIACRGRSRGRVQGVSTPPPPEMTCGFLIQLVFCQKILCSLLVVKQNMRKGWKIYVKWRENGSSLVVHPWLVPSRLHVTRAAGAGGDGKGKRRKTLSLTFLLLITPLTPLRRDRERDD